MSTPERLNGSDTPVESVEKQIRQLEQSIAGRQRLIALQCRLVVKRIQAKQVTPGMLLLAAGGGFVLDRLTRSRLRPDTNPELSNPDKAPSQYPPNANMALQIALELLTLMEISESARERPRG